MSRPIEPSPCQVRRGSGLRWIEAREATAGGTRCEALLVEATLSERIGVLLESVERARVPLDHVQLCSDSMIGYPSCSKLHHHRKRGRWGEQECIMGII